MDTPSLVRIFLSLFFVVGLIGLAALLARRFKLDRLTGALRKGGRISIEEQLHLDSKRKLVLVRCDNEEHLLLLGMQQDILVRSLPVKEKSHA